MSAAEKALARLRARPNDLQWKELERVLERLDFEDITTHGGSHRKFRHRTSGRRLYLAKPHPDPVKEWVVNATVDQLEEWGYL